VGKNVRTEVCPPPFSQWKYGPHRLPGVMRRIGLLTETGLEQPTVHHWHPSPRLSRASNVHPTLRIRDTDAASRRYY